MFWYSEYEWGTASTLTLAALAGVLALFGNVNVFHKVELYSESIKNITRNFLKSSIVRNG
jgi:hypothetical protein